MELMSINYLPGSLYWNDFEDEPFLEVKQDKEKQASQDQYL